MKKKLLIFSGIGPENQLELQAAQSYFDVTQKTEESPQSILQQAQHDVVIIDESDYVQFEPYLPVLDWQVSQLRVADCLVLQDQYYRPLHCEAEAILRVIRANSHRINSQEPVIVIGEVGFVSAVVMKLAMGGFNDIMAAFVGAQDEELEAIRKKFQGLVFNLNLKVITAMQLVSIDYSASLMISKFKKEMNKEAYELMTYFNFLSSTALLIDCHSCSNNYLVEEARRAEVGVIEEEAVTSMKYTYLSEIMKNSP
ncbi:hypothetical protein [Pseudobdellovibrio exovorus]|uniref:Uncharacterized protein n=1 Tax=Pseudobdellovibrio exovorus JSS TaxID=1184267 RepID=M4VPT7_9BACT|nr:hypothetical protein [Pseudobdellovibrio exovorus]AGH95144.1 hypothetical protein A11Q_928 [Pseudobdellovibrio exovorus JSS]